MAGQSKAVKSKSSGAAAPQQAGVGGNNVLPGSPQELRNMAMDAEKAGDLGKAEHLFTMAVNAAAKGMARNQDGVAKDADLVKCNKATEGELSKLLAKRSHVYLRQGKAEAAAEDADACTRADPQLEVGHQRLLQAYEALCAPMQSQLEACERGLAECPGSEYLVAAKWRLKKAIAEQPPDVAKAQGQVLEGDREAVVEQTRRLANDKSDPRHTDAASDYGSLLATGAHGVEKDLKEAERYLRMGADGGCVVARRNLGLLLLDLGQPVEASQELSKAASEGDEQAIETLRLLMHEAEVRRKEMLAKLEDMAEAGDPRAKEMLADLLAQE